MTSEKQQIKKSLEKANKLKNVSKIKWEVVKHRLGGYCVSRDGKLLESIFRLKSDAVKHKSNLKNVADAIDAKYSKALNDIKK